MRWSALALNLAATPKSRRTPGRQDPSAPQYVGNAGEEDVPIASHDLATTMSSESDPRPRAPKPRTEPRASSSNPKEVFALGYQGRDLEEVLGILRLHRIEQVLDVRKNAFSRKPGFSSTELRQALGRIGIAYVPLPQLGCRSEERRALWRGGEIERFLAEYAKLVAERPSVVADLLRRVGSARSLLLCLERDPSRCHRAVLVRMLREARFAVEELPSG